MDNYLGNQCNALGIKLIYTTNKIKILSSNVVNGRPTLRVHKLFNNCEISVSDAIINYYTKDNSNKDDYKIIEDYIKSLNPELSFIIALPNKLIIDIFKNKNISYENNKPSDIVEMQILTISQKSFMNNEIKSNHEIIAEEEDVLELNICVKPFNT